MYCQFCIRILINWIKFNGNVTDWMLSNFHIELRIRHECWLAGRWWIGSDDCSFIFYQHNGERIERFLCIGINVRKWVALLLVAYEHQHFISGFLDFKRAIFPRIVLIKFVSKWILCLSILHVLSSDMLFVRMLFWRLFLCFQYVYIRSPCFESILNLQREQFHSSNPFIAIYDKTLRETN